MTAETARTLFVHCRGADLTADKNRLLKNLVQQNGGQLDDGWTATSETDRMRVAEFSKLPANFKQICQDLKQVGFDAYFAQFLGAHAETCGGVPIKQK
jgi:hypothetical protein